MPYCIGDGFAQSMLAKVKTTDYTGLITYHDYNSSGDISVNYTVPETNTYSIVYRLYANYTQYTYWMGIMKNWTVLVSSASNNYWRRCEVRYNGTLTAGDVITVQHGGVPIWAAEITINYTKTFMVKPVTKIYWYPIETKNIWEIGKATIQGIHPNDNNYKWGVILKTDTAATTGSITLWNAVGFLVVNFNWNLVKIPYYT